MVIECWPNTGWVNITDILGPVGNVFNPPMRYRLWFSIVRPPMFTVPNPFPVEFTYA